MPWARWTLLILLGATTPFLSCRAQGATATPVMPTTQPGNAYFPSAGGNVWKYLVVETREGNRRQYVQTLREETIEFKSVSLIALGDDLYLAQGDGLYLFGHRNGADVKPLDAPQKILPAKLRAGEAWTSGAGVDASYCTCLGNRPVKTAAGEFTTQCVFVTASAAADGTPLKQTYRYYAKDVGLVRETVIEKLKASDAAASFEMTRELASVSVAAAPARATPTTSIALGCNAVHGRLVDSGGQAIAQASLLVRRTDKQWPSVSEQTDLDGRFTFAELDPAGAYVLSTALAGYEPTELPLHSADGKAAEVTVRLAAAETSTPKDDAFAAAKKLAGDGKHAEAIAKYDEAAKLDPRNGAILAYRAQSHLALNQAREAQADVDAALKLEEKNPIVWQAAGQVKLAQGQVAQGKLLFQKAAQASPQTAGAIYTDLAAALSSKNDPKLAGDIEAALKSAANANPTSPEALFQLGQGYANAGRQEGKAYLQKYVEVSARLPADQRDDQKAQLAKQLIRALDAVKDGGR